MQYKFANITKQRATIGDLKEKIDLETYTESTPNDLSGLLTDTISVIATVWAAVIDKNIGAFRMLGINTDKQEIITHIFCCRYWNTAFLETRFIKWNGNRYVVDRTNNLEQYVNTNGQIFFPCAFKGTSTLESSKYR